MGREWPPREPLGDKDPYLSEIRDFLAYVRVSGFRACSLKMQ